ncbi:MAG: monooxygenase [Burkholderiales bacterium]
MPNLVRLRRAALHAALGAGLLAAVPAPLYADRDAGPDGGMVVAVVTYALPRAATLADVKRVAARGADRYLNLPGLLRKNYWLSEDGTRAGGIYVWESRARAEAFYTREWKQVVTRQYGVAPDIVYLHSPVMVDNTAGRIVTDAE